MESIKLAIYFASYGVGVGESVWVSVRERVLEKMLLLESKIRLEIILKLATLGKVFFSCSEQLYQSVCPSVGLSVCLGICLYICIRSWDKC